MFFTNLSNAWRRVGVWLSFAILLLVSIALIRAGIRARSTSSSSGATASAKTSAGTSFSMLSTQARNDVNEDVVDGEGIEIITTDVLLYPNTAIYAEGHPVYISGTTSAQNGYRAKTTIWVDENENGKRESGEYLTVRSSIAASYYVYGGSDSIATNTNKISITMTGGEIGAIFAGGQYQNVTTQSVDIQITGGSVHYVDCGSQCSSLGESLTASGSINVLLKNCKYRCNIPINLIEKNSFHCDNVTVRDFSEHKNAQSYNRHYPVFTHYIAPIAQNSYVFGGQVSVPSDRDIQADHIVLAEDAVVTNEGRVGVADCKSIYLMGSGSAIWRGNDIETSHNEDAVLYYDYKTHTRTCKDCGQTLCKDHFWVYSYATGGAKTNYHSVKCAACGYTYSEPCTKVYTYDNDYIKMTACKYCRHDELLKYKLSSSNSSCTHSSTKKVSITRHHTENEPEGIKEYDITHNAVICESCGLCLPFTLTYSGKEYHFLSMSPLCRFIANNSIETANVKMNFDVFSEMRVDTIKTSGTFNLDLNGCDLGSQVLAESGIINISNSKFTDSNYPGEEHYAYIPTGDLANQADATVSVDGCAINMLYVGKSGTGVTLAKMSLGNVIVKNLYVYGPDWFTPTGKIKITERFSKASTYMGQYMPEGYVIMECLGNGSWVKRFKRSIYWNYSAGVAGPMATGSGQMGPIGFMPCPQHKLNTATSNGSATHSGTCIYCDARVSMNHELSAGTNYNDSLHTVKCDVCAYTKTGTTAYHDYDTDGKCVVSGCNHQAAVSVHGHYSPLKTYFHAFDDALEAVNVPGMYDTITLYSNQYVKHPFTLQQKLVRIFKYNSITFNRGAFVLGSTAMRSTDFAATDSVPVIGQRANVTFSPTFDLSNYTSMGPRIYIDGGTYKLGKGTNGSINTNGMTANEHYRLEMSGNTSQYWSELPITVAPGYERDPKVLLSGATSWVSVFPCTHSYTWTYESIADQNSSTSSVTKYMAQHKKICPNCDYVVYEEHKYEDNQCTKCGVASSAVIAARVRWTKNNKEHVYGFKTLTEAWSAAVDSSAANGVSCTVQVLKNIILGSESSISNAYLGITKSTASIILDATDDEGRNHFIIGAPSANYLIFVRNGKLTIKGGTFCGYKMGVCAFNCSNLTVEGGIFLNGLSSSAETIYDGLAIINRPTTQTVSVLSCLPAGYSIVTVSNGNYVRKDKVYAHAYSSKNALSASNLYAINGEVMPCPHSSYEVIPAQAATCNKIGHDAYLHCYVCNYYVNQSTGEVSALISSKAAYGHRFTASSNDVCVTCGVHKDAVVCSEYSSEGTLLRTETVTGIQQAWEKLYDWEYYNAISGTNNFVIKLNADETMPSGESIGIHSFGEKITIDLNGYNLNIGDGVWYLSSNSVTVKNGNLTGFMSQSSNDNRKLILDNATLRAYKLNAMNLEMINGAVLVMDGGIKDDADIVLKNITMEEDCKLRGENCSHFFLKSYAQYGDLYDYDSDDIVPDLAHSTAVYQLTARGETVEGMGDSKIWNRSSGTDGLRKVTVGTSPKNTSYQYIASTCYTWEATKHDIQHTLNGRDCSVCGLTTQHLVVFDGYSTSPYYHKDAYDNRLYNEVSYRRYINRNVWTPLYIPISIEPGEHTEDYDLAEIYSFGRICDTNGNGKIDDGDETWLIVDRITSGTTDPNYPYLVRFKSTCSGSSYYYFASTDNYAYKAESNSVSCSTSQTKYTFTGTDGSVAVPANTLVMSNGVLKATANQSYPTDHTWYMNAASKVAASAEYRQLMSSGMRIMVMGEDISEETAIQLLQGETVEIDLEGQHYTLDGRKATRTESGIKLVNGHKVIVK